LFCGPLDYKKMYFCRRLLLFCVNTVSASSGVRNMAVECLLHNQNFILTIVKNTQPVTLFCGNDPRTDTLVYTEKIIRTWVRTVWLHWSTKFNFLFCPTNFNRWTHAEFRYVYIIFISGRVSKIQRNLMCKVVLYVLMKQAETFL
jgi:hypothetical protein